MTRTGTMKDSPLVAFFPEGAYGPTNNCVGIADVLRRRGVRVVFVVEESFAGTLEARGFDEALMRLKPPPAEPESPGQFWKDFIRDTAPEFRKSTFEQLETLIKPIWQELIDGATYVEARLREIFADLRPDVIVQDNVVAFPAVLTAGKPWVRIVSCNPLEIPDPALPPAYSGLPMEDPSGWQAFRDRYRDLHHDLHANFNAFVEKQGAPPLGDGQFIHTSRNLDLYVYPESVDYPRREDLRGPWHRLDSSVRGTDSEYHLPADLERGGPLIYLSLGSLGAADTVLMQRLIDLLAATPYRVIVSMGPQHELLRLPQNMTGAEFLPQTAILPMVDVVITHGGNNTVTECFHFGKPMIVLPLFWDQHDNAQRVHETRCGVRVSTYEFEDRELLDSIESLLADAPLRSRLADVSGRLQARPGTERAADLIEELARA